MQRLTRILFDLVSSTKGLSWTGLANRISERRKIKFQRQNFYRLRAGELGDENVDYIVEYLEAEHDPGIRDRLHPSTIFDELAKPARDYYFHIPEPNDIDEWNEQILDEFSGVYFCAPAGVPYTYWPARRLRKQIGEHTKVQNREPQRTGLALTLFATRTILVLRATPHGYFHAAEIPLSALVPTNLKLPSRRVFYEGIAVISANTIQVKLRDCLSRVPRTHAIAILGKSEEIENQPFGLSLFTAGKEKEIESSWRAMEDDDIRALKREHEIAIASEYYLIGKAMHSASPLLTLSSGVSNIAADALVYFPKPSDFLENLETHFFLGDLIDVDTIQKIVENSLPIGFLHGG